MNVVVIGCGVVGAAIAYELSQVKGISVTVLDKHQPATASTGAALGVLMGIISHKIKGNAWRMRLHSIQRYETWIPELEALTGRSIPYNRQGILMLLSEVEEMSKWEKLVDTRRSQGFPLEIWNAEQIKNICPQIDTEKNHTAIYSPSDRQVNPTALTLALVEAAQHRGVTFKFGVDVLGAEPQNSAEYRVLSPENEERKDFLLTQQRQSPQRGEPNVVRPEGNPPYDFSPHGAGSSGLSNASRLNGGNPPKFVRRETLLTTSLRTGLALQDCFGGTISADWFVIASGLGSSLLTAQLKQMVDIRPVLGQALHMRLEGSLGNLNFQPVITGDDVHIVPTSNGDYWVGATVEFPSNENDIPPNQELLESVRKRALAFCPDLAKATIIRTWSGLRPRPEGRPAPIIGKLPGFSNILLATGHYRNGVLLAPATADTIREMIISNI
ncbi:MAG: FAD-dependent oxidoreductase [Rhizonema sp. NSF051]|nr:FAD-dependent oxidoreductase [Rhizonema sp. NSF051]